MSDRVTRTTCPYCGVGCGVLVRREESDAPLTQRAAGGDWATAAPQATGKIPPAPPFKKGGTQFSVRGDPAHPANLGRLCSKGAALGETLSLDDRLLHPEIGGQRVTWDTALDTVAHRFRQVIAEQIGRASCRERV